MLVKQPKKTESKPAWRFLQFFGLENSRESASAGAKNRLTKEPEERKHQFATWYIFAAFLGVMLIQYLWVQYTQTETIPYSQFEQLVDENKISEVLVGSDTIQGTLKEPFPDGRKLFNTTRVEPDLAAKLSAHGVKVTGAPSSNFLSTILSWVLPDFTMAIERIVAGLEKKSRVLGPEERRRVAYHEMGHALVAATLPGVDPVHKVSIIPRGVGALGYTIQRPTEDRFLLARHDLENRISVLMGGRAAEALIFDGEVSTGASDDLQRATEIATEMVTRYGMNETVGPRTYAPPPQPFLTGSTANRVEASEAKPMRCGQFNSGQQP